MRSTTPLAILFSLLAGWVRAGEMLKPGDLFPAWNLIDDRGTAVSSADLAGKSYLLWYYPKALTPGCTTEACALRDSYAEFEKSGVTPIGVSFDEPGDNAEFVAKHGLPFRLLSDRSKELAVAVGAADSPSRMWARRISYLVGADGKVLKAYANVSPSGHAAEVLADFAALAR